MKNFIPDWNMEYIEEFDMYDLAVFITRAQPFHKGHEYAIREATRVAKQTLVLVGSAFSSRNIKNPFTYDERYSMIMDWARNNEDIDIDVAPLADFLYEENQWLTEVQDIVAQYGADRVCIVGHEKDISSYYINSFPQWDKLTLTHWEKISATDIRNLYFTISSKLMWKSAVSESTYKFLLDFSYSEAYSTLNEEFKFVKEYKESWAGSPFPPTFNTVDAVVIQSGHILLIKRGSQPGKGLWALPGGFIGQDETQLDAAIRELREETKLKVPIPVLKGSIKKEHTFDNPSRSTRGRTITQAFLFQLDDSLGLPKVKGSDDAVYAKWISLADYYIMEPEIYEDHFSIVRYMVDNT